MAKILARLDEMYPAATCALHPFECLGAAGGDYPFGSVHRQARQRSDSGVVSQVSNDPGFRRRQPGGDGAGDPLDWLLQQQSQVGDWRGTQDSWRIMAGEVPRDMDSLLTVPGAARKTANVVLGTAFGIASGVVVDTHVQRISRRLDLTKETEPVKIERDLMQVVPKEKWILFSHQLIHHGRALCVARNPKCAECKLDPLCYAKDKTI